MNRITQHLYGWILPIKPIYFDPGFLTAAWKWYGGYGQKERLLEIGR